MGEHRFAKPCSTEMETRAPTILMIEDKEINAFYVRIWVE